MTRNERRGGQWTRRDEKRRKRQWTRMAETMDEKGRGHTEDH
jgi:hypothetical protein